MGQSGMQTRVRPLGCASQMPDHSSGVCRGLEYQVHCFARGSECSTLSCCRSASDGQLQKAMPAFMPMLSANCDIKNIVQMTLTPQAASARAATIAKSHAAILEREPGVGVSLEDTGDYSQAGGEVLEDAEERGDFGHGGGVYGVPCVRCYSCSKRPRSISARRSASSAGRAARRSGPIRPTESRSVTWA